MYGYLGICYALNTILLSFLLGLALRWGLSVECSAVDALGSARLLDGPKYFI